ncbi:LysR family transcriptional regulator [Alteraurantiacibacter aestuarii]|uniref:LysR family transcriptional regulator n=1 Tax=Alteraurantiacibacter aestuarii TaxID=650004 RepID=A0A844ZP07_9SPHN|nr:LysR family transcriptional regulator [Alteraurantiacibacter aestuarii]MXO88776.1 LysR family transcriptional regulator [Alteraurantiacibacter aestuarii]
MDRLKLKIQLLCADQIAIGPGKADLLDAIRDTGSISAAARALGMSYRRAWQLVDVMNRCFAEKLVETQPGGGGSAGARLTDAGTQMLAAYRALSAQVEGHTGGEDFDTLAQGLRKVPLPPAD